MRPHIGDGETSIATVDKHFDCGYDIGSPIVNNMGVFVCGQLKVLGSYVELFNGKFELVAHFMELYQWYEIICRRVYGGLP